jgi:hypothetical protein
MRKKACIFYVKDETANDLQVGAVAVIMAPGGDYQGNLLLENMEYR